MSNEKQTNAIETVATVSIATDTGEVKLSPSIVKKFLVSGKPEYITDEEVVLFIKLCQYQKLNPFLREVYLVKYSKNSAATMVTGKETFTKRAQKNPKYQGHQTFISDDGKKAWAEVHVEGYKVPIRCEVDLDEYIGKKEIWKNGNPTGEFEITATWKRMPKTMLKKVALVQTLREAFPADLGGLYSQEEISHVDTDQLPQKDVVITDNKQEPKAETTPEKPMETIVPEVEQPGFTPYIKGGENVKVKEPPVVETKAEPKEEPKAPSLKESSAKLRDEYLVSIANLKTSENCRYLLSTMATKAGLFTDQDRKVLNAGFEAKRAEILAAEKAAAINPTEAPAKKPEILNEGDKVKVEVNGKVVIRGTIEKFGIVQGRRTVKLKESATPVFADLCTKE